MPIRSVDRPVPIVGVSDPDRESADRSSSAAASVSRSPSLAPGDVVWVTLRDAVGREQDGHRPALVVASAGYLALVDMLVLVVPVSGTDRGWPNHVLLTGPHGLASDSFAMTEQLRAVSRTRITAVSGAVEDACLHRVRLWLGDFLDLTVP